MPSSPQPRASAEIGRILWNVRGEDIDEVVLRDVEMLHIEQMDDNCWWIGVSLKNGGYWAGNFTTRGKMRFSEQERDGFDWDEDSAHDGEAPK